MATPQITDEEIQFRKRARRRLVGAVVLVLVVVVVVPWILPADKPPQETQEIEIRIPAQDATGLAPKMVSAPLPQPVPEKASSVAPAPAGVAGAAQPAAAAATGAVPEGGKGEQTAAASAPKPGAEPKAAPAAPGFFVQFGAFSEARNAAQKQAELKARGIATFTEVVKTSSGDKIRVRSGPYATREEAEKVQQKAKPLDSKLVPADGRG